MKLCETNFSPPLTTPHKPTCPQSLPSNAITILVSADHSFSRQDLNGVRIPGSSLSGGWTNLSPIAMQLWLDGANMNNSNLTFGEFQLLSGHSDSDVCFSLDGKRLASGRYDHTVRV